ncbi:MAG: restriction endonuclease subunit S [Erythrobacter sp.]|uniref:restriction endonuclease subunit S n=1 Tax=Erythrobacter sp. TaxID=1042 RepID=UPI0032EF014B
MSDVQRVIALPSGWQEMRLNDFCEQPKASSQPEADALYNLWSVPSFDNQEPENVLGRDVKSSKKHVQVGDVLLCKINPRINRVWRVTGSESDRHIASTEWIVLRPNGAADYDPAYLQAYLSSPAFREWIVSETKGATGSHTRAKVAEVMRQPIPLPPLEEQKRIVAVLDQAFAALDRARANAEANLADVEELLGASIAEMFARAGGGASLPLSKVSKFEGGSQPPKSQFISEPREGYIRLLQIRDFKSDDKAVYIPDDGKRRRCKADDILIGRYGASVGQIHRGKAGCYNVALIKTSPDPKVIDRDYFYYFLKSDLFQKPLLSRSSRGAQDGFNKGDIADFPVPLPALDEQRIMVDQIVKIEEQSTKLARTYEAAVHDVDDLCQSFLQKAFAGELT